MVCKPQEIIHFHVHNLDFSPLADAIKRAKEMKNTFINLICVIRIFMFILSVDIAEAHKSFAAIILTQNIATNVSTRFWIRFLFDSNAIAS